MEFKKINDYTFECRLSKEDLEDYDISIEDFLRDRDKTIDFMRQIIEQSENEIDFEPSSGVMSMQIMPLPGDGLSLTFTSRNPSDDSDVMTHVRDIIKSHIESLLQSPNSSDEEEKKKGMPERTSDVTDLNDLMNELSERKENKETSKAAVVWPQQRMFFFGSFSKLEGFCKSCIINTSIKSQVMKQSGVDGYYLVINKGKLSGEEFDKITENLSEYGDFVTDDPVVIMNISEHSDIIIDKNAVAVIHEL